MRNARIFKIENAISYGYDEKVEININFFNPRDNIPKGVFKIKTYEVYQDSTGNSIEYLMD